jgi:hypothetical protein
MMDRHPLLFLSCIIAGFALLRAPYSGFLAPLHPVGIFLGELAILFFSTVLIFQGILYLFGKR